MSTIHQTIESSRGEPDPWTHSAVSFRDPAGRLIHQDGRILRVVRPAAAAELQCFLDSATGQQLMQQGRLVQTTRLPEHGKAAVYEHERIPFPSHPYEWPPEMLHAAGRLTIELARALLREGWGLKDATPYNVLFLGPQPVFVDVLSVERRTAGDPTWMPYAQFARTFLLPLAVNRDLGLTVAELLAQRRDGLEPETVYRWLASAQRWRSPYLTFVSIPAWLSRNRKVKDGSIYQRRTFADQERARFVVGSLLKGLDRRLKRLEPMRHKHSVWSGYMDTHSYQGEDFQEKESFVRGVLAEFTPSAVLDAGCNNGHFSRLAARAGARVVAVDYEEAVVGMVWRRAVDEGLNILPLVVNLTRPTPAMGWRNRESASFLDRARGSFDAVFMLALIHHMLVSERIPLEEVIALAAELTTGLAVIEYVSPADEMFRKLARGRDELHQDLSEARFEEACRKRFEILRSRPLKGGLRRVYLLRKRQDLSES